MVFFAVFVVIALVASDLLAVGAKRTRA